MSGREKGVATAPCPNCGTEIPVVTAPDGAVTTEVCPKCYPTNPKAEKASAPAGRERGTEPAQNAEEAPSE